MPQSPPNLRDLIGECFDLAPPARAEFLDRALGHDPALRARAQRLLEAHDRAHKSGFLDRETLPATERMAFMSTQVMEGGPAGPADLIGARIGNYRIRALVGTGGMGSVYEATQESPRRTVALKIMRSGLLSPSAFRRFEYEAQVLARLRHTGIAQVYDAGTHIPDAGPFAARLSVPFFVMELVPDGRSITEFASAHSLDTASRLRLFLSVCEAVQHAHQKGIIHRDLKPSNILIDAYGHPKLIDFGVARIEDPGAAADSALPTLQTRAGQLIGTLAYMSPEQCGPDSSDIDVRSDVYSLGVVLFELLTGHPPYILTDAAVAEATRIIRETPPSRLSSLDTRLRGDLETIVAKALEKDRTRRYQSADDLADDIRQFLAGERISARPASMVYQLRLLARRHRPTVLAAAALALAIVLGLVGTSIGFYRATRERDRALLLQMQARDETRRALKIATFLKSTIAAADPNVIGQAGSNSDDPLDDWAARSAVFAMSGGNLSTADLLSAASQHLDTAFADEPLTRAELQTTIGQTLFQFGRFVEAVDLLSSATATREKLLGPDNDYTIESRRLLAMAMQNQGQLQDSLPLFETNFKPRAAGIADAQIPSIIAARDLTQAYSILGRSQDALDLITRTRDAAAAKLGPDHEITLRLTVDVASHLWNKGECNKAIETARAAVAALRKSPGENSPGTANAMWQLANLTRRSGPLAESEELLRAVIALIQTRHGDAPAPPLTAKIELLYTLRRQQRYTEAAALAQDILAANIRTYGPDSHRSVRARSSLARTIMYLPDRAEEAVMLAASAADQARQVLAQDDPNAWLYRAIHAEALRRAGDPQQAEQILRTLRATITASGNEPGEWVTGMIHQYLGTALLDQGRLDEAETELLAAWSGLESGTDTQNERRRETAQTLAALATKRANQPAAAAWLRKADPPAVR